jgi:hypothetical protein
MFRLRDVEAYETGSEAGVRHLFRVGSYEFQDTLDEDETFHRFILDSSNEEAGLAVYEVDTETMYEFMARYLAGVYEKAEYGMEQSPGHAALLDLLEIATARARAGETEFNLDEITRGETEVLGDAEETDEDGWEGEDDEDDGEEKPLGGEGRGPG